LDARPEQLSLAFSYNLMKFVSVLILTAFLSSAFGGGSISWSEVVERINRSDPKLIEIIQKNFSVERVGDAVRVGYRVDPEHAGDRIPPYSFMAIQKDGGRKVVLEINQSPDFEFTGRYFLVCTPIKAEQSATPTHSQAHDEGSVPIYPLESVTVRGDLVIAKISKECGGLYLKEGSHLSDVNAGDLIKLKSGDSVTLFSHMASFKITARISTKASGLDIENHYRTSFSDDSASTEYRFIKAEPAAAAAH
jgi:hypothetical protein